MLPNAHGAVNFLNKDAIFSIRRRRHECSALSENAQEELCSVGTNKNNAFSFSIVEKGP
jgi:hypothetical protein